MNGYDNYNSWFSRYEEYFIQQMKIQERIAVQAVAQAKQQQCIVKGIQLSLSLEEEARKMKDYVSRTFVANIQEGFEGAAADRAQEYLKQEMKKPVLKNPITP
ncbi:hypothetical protein [Streptococcus oriscaviae]|uniref:Phage protein n=1 Tax=Streptococcus oriscaviae TaxID=2781599 RepID=A0ABX7YN54_9STRE|nr:hypothetical protein [Streptococcus oriscaviae]QUE55270.1 hypothetical protein INT76_05180 [Streptococcus oriscaviae]